ncbi:hypothetical protein [Leptospira sp. GIMC2001]|uniref:hypothetical protein n=1 Tax=Leptospira sp. GIMC2001 TaxID=1513297 RepID=UPI002349ED19|nr:hypothetical protein [Leptospira sp. GIMC2001]WCL49745.1 hypothetical protein O4O04_02685 [Leptospira sp. GIMC2001]
MNQKIVLNAEFKYNSNLPVRFILSSLKLIFLISLCFSFMSCIAYSNPELINLKISTPSIQRPFQIDWIGFAKYPKEKELLKQTFVEMGITESKQSIEILEIMLEEREVFYDYPALHFGNFVLSFISGTAIPFHTITEHSVSIRVRGLNGIKFESESVLVLNQWRGILLVPLTPFFWPSLEFKRILELEVKKIMCEYEKKI